MSRILYLKSLTVLMGVLLVAATWSFVGTAAPHRNFYLKDGDRVVFYGDSITDHRLYTTFVESYVLTRFPRLHVRFVHSGWGGDRVTGGGGGPVDLRLRRDVFAYKPTVMTIMLGMNDGGYRAFDAALFNTFATGYQHLIDSVKSALPGVRITVIQPSPYDDVVRSPQFEGGYNAVLLRYGQFVKELGERQRLTIADLNTPVVAAVEKAKASNAELAKEILPDRVHPSRAGHLLLAEALLKAWNAPATVSSVEIDAINKRVVKTESTKVTELESSSGFSWMQLDNALPMPFDLGDPVVVLVLRSSDFLQALDQQLLKVTGLPAGNYTLKIEGEQVGSFSNQQLAEGIDLAQLPTPMAKQAMATHDLTLKHNTIHYARWRQVQVPLENEHLAHLEAALAALDGLENEVVAQQRATAQPKPRHYKLTPQN